MTKESRPSTDGADVAAGEERVVPMRLQKFLARAGVASRRGSEDLMTAQRVSVNGAVITELGFKVDPLVDEVAVDGKVVGLAEGPAYFALHKPPEIMTTMSDPQGRRTVVEFFPPDAPAGLFPVGRLDYNSEGLLLLMTDGDLAQQLLHPKHHVTKTYLATVQGVPTPATLSHLRQGVELDDGMTAPAGAVLVSQTGGASREGGRAIVELRISEGRKRQVRRMMKEVGHPVTKLVRVGFGPVQLGSLPAGHVRPLAKNEVEALKRAGE
jgi:23S rRNA pseudouridine2605 synthase